MTQDGSSAYSDLPHLRERMADAAYSGWLWCGGTCTALSWLTYLQFAYIHMLVDPPTERGREVRRHTLALCATFPLQVTLHFGALFMESADAVVVGELLGTVTDVGMLSVSCVAHMAMPGS